MCLRLMVTLNSSVVAGATFQSWHRHRHFGRMASHLAGLAKAVSGDEFIVILGLCAETLRGSAYICVTGCWSLEDEAALSTASTRFSAGLATASVMTTEIDESRVPRGSSDCDAPQSWRHPTHRWAYQARVDKQARQAAKRKRVCALHTSRALG